MGQNTSSAVMQQRKEPHDSLDDFPTPPWATRALCEWIEESWDVSEETVREPAANRGYMSNTLEEYFGTVYASDIHDYGAGIEQNDYLFGLLPERTDWTITNPPFRLAEQFIERALQCSAHVAVLVRSAFLETIGRYDRLYSIHPPTDILQFTERVTMVKGRLANKDVSTATAYIWLVWDSNYHANPPQFHWIPPCRKRLERPDDTD